MKTAFLLVTCCLEQSRADILSQVLKNLREQAPQLRDQLTVFDNASTVAGVTEALLASYSGVYRADKNVGFWTAIDWWLDSLRADPPEYTYIIESDMIHYAFHRLEAATKHLDDNPEVGSVRLHEYSVANWQLYNKDAPAPGARPSAWWSHTNRVTNKPVKRFEQCADGVWKTSFLTQLPALNRYALMVRAFNALRAMPQFTEIDFQRLYWEQHNVTGLLDGGIFTSDLGGNTAINRAIGSWTPQSELEKMGYVPTRVARIVPRDQYTVTKLA